MSLRRRLPISSFCRTGSGTTPPRSGGEAYYGGGIPWVKSGELREAEITATEETVTDRALSETALKLAPAGSLLVAMYGATVGRVGILKVPATTNQAVCHIVPDPQVADTRYMFHALQHLAPYFVSRGAGGAQPNISQGLIQQTEVYLPPLDEQRRIAAILDQANAVRRMRKEALGQLASLQRALFLHRFGDPFSNPLNWPLISLGDLISNVSNGITRRRADGETGEHVVLRLRDIGAGWIDFSDPNRITLFDSERARFLVSNGDLLFVRVNGNPDYVGRCAVFTDKEEDIYFNDHIMRVSIRHHMISPFFLQSTLNSQFGRTQISRHRKTSAGQHTINQDGLSKITIPLPPVRLQNQFAGEWAEIGTQIHLETGGEKELDALFASLQHRAFRGEL